MRSSLRTGVLAALLAAGCLPPEGGGRPGLSEYNVDEAGLALRGYSPVAYFEGRAEPGSAEWSLTHRGITYRFADAAERDRFAADPERYEPAFGGWCAYGISLGIRWDADPEAFRLVDGRLFLFSRTSEADARDLWEREKDPADLVRRADRYWRSLLEP